MRVVKLLIFAVIIAFGVTSANAQRVAETASQYAVDTWNRRASDLRNAIAAESYLLTTGERAFFLSELAAMTWDLDRDAAKEILKRSSRAAIASLETRDNELLRQFSGATKAIATITRLDPELGQKTLEEFIKKATEKVDGDVRSAEVLTELAIFLADSETEKAYDAGVRALQLETSPQFYKIIGTLNLSDQRRADSLLELTLARGPLVRDRFLAARLAFLAREGFRGKPMSEISKMRVLDRFADLLDRALRDEQDRNQSCRIVGPVIYLTSEYERLMPARLTIIRAQSKICQAFVNVGAIDAAQKFSGLDADELIRESRNQPDPVIKGKLISMAVEKFNDTNEFERGISALDGLSEDERRAYTNDAWRSWRIEFAALAARQYLRDDDRPAFYRIVDRSPSTLRAAVRLNILPDIIKANDDLLALEMADNAFKEFGNSVENDPQARAAGFLGLTKHFLKLRPTDADASFRLATKALNEIDSLNKENALEKEYAPLETRLHVPFQLLEDDESGLLSVIKSISKTRTRVRVELGLLESVLTKYAEVQESSRPRRRVADEK